MEKRVFIAVVLSIIVILVYPLILAKINPDLVRQVDKPQPLQNKEITVKKADTKPGHAQETNTLPSNATITNLNTDKYNIEVSDIGGSISSIIVKDTKRRHDVLLVNNAIFEAGILSLGGKGEFSGLSSQPFTLQDDAKIMVSQTNDLRIEKNISFLDDKYGASASIKITNTGTQIQNMACDVTTGSNISKKEIFENRYVELAISYKDGSTKRITGGNLLNYNRLYKDNIAWAALKNKYYSIIAKPDFNAKGVFTKNISGEPSIGFIIEDEKILPRETRVYNLNFYIGPMEIKELEKVDPEFIKALNFGFLTSISLILLSVLQFFHSIFHNYGVAILLLTLCISMFLYPLTFKSLKSMQKLQELQPHMERIRQENKNNPAKLNKEIMELYRRYNVNPMSGCLPMVFQMPVFIALYNTLSRSVELKNASFLWIKDLSMPDAFFKFKSSVPFFGNSINLLPILMIGAMILQQKTSRMNIASAQTDQQKMMTNIMPIMFGVIFYSLPSGLVLYWLTSTLVTGGLQVIVFRKIK